MPRRSKETSQKQLAANRRNALQSTGPRVSRRALLRQSRYVKTLSYDQAKLGESSEDFQEFLADLVADWQPMGAMEMTLVEDLATLEMERRLVDRAQRGRLVHRLEREQAKVDRNTRRLLDEATADVTREDVVEKGLRNSPDCPAKFRQMMDLLEPLMATVRCGDFSSPAEEIFIALYGQHPSWRAAQIISLYGKFVERYAQAPEDFPVDEEPETGEEAVAEDSACGEEEANATAAAEGVTEPAPEEPGALPSAQNTASATPSAASPSADGSPFADSDPEFFAPSEHERLIAELSVPFESPDGRTPWGEAEHEPSQRPSMDEGDFRTLYQLLLEEFDAVVSDYGDFMHDCAALTRSRRDALLAPAGYRSALLIRQKNSIDRHLERKIKLLILLQKERREREACPARQPTGRGRRHAHPTGSGAKAHAASVRNCAPARQRASARRRTRRPAPTSRLGLRNSAAPLAGLWIAQLCASILANAKRAATLAAIVGAFILLGADLARPRPTQIATHQGLSAAPTADQSRAQAPNHVNQRDVFLRVESHYVFEKKAKGMETTPNWEGLVSRPLSVVRGPLRIKIDSLSHRAIESLKEEGPCNRSMAKSLNGPMA